MQSTPSFFQASTRRRRGSVPMPCYLILLDHEHGTFRLIPSELQRTAADRNKAVVVFLGGPPL